MRTLILAGIARNVWVLFTANDDYLRDYELFVPSDCCASNPVAENRHALRQMKAILKADTRPAAKIDLGALVNRRRSPRAMPPERRTTPATNGATAATDEASAPATGVRRGPPSWARHGR